MQTVRVRFRKEGRAKYISHLDLNRFMARAVRRAHLPVWFTQGFNPHPYITFAMPLSIFQESVCEAMDLRMEEDLNCEEIKERLSAQMPEGIAITEVYPPEMKPGDIAFARYRLVLGFENRSGEELAVAFRAMLNAETLIVSKKTKRGFRDIDTKPFLSKASVEYTDGSMRLTVILPASSQETVNPSCLFDAMEQYAGLKPEDEQTTRLELCNERMEPFR